MKYPKRPILILLFLILIMVEGFGQNFIIYSNKTFGGTENDFYGNILHLGNYEFIIGAETGSDISGDKTEPLCYPFFPGQPLIIDTWVLKIDTAFNIIWQQNIGSNNLDRQPVFRKVPNSNNIIYSTFTLSDSSCDKSQPNHISQSSDFWMVLIDSLGNKLFDKTYGSLSGNDRYPEVLPLSTGGYILSGSTSGGIGGDKTVPNYGADDFWVIKTDSLGNKIWDNVYGGVDREHAAYGFDLLACENGGFIMTGFTDSPVSGSVSQPGQGFDDVWIIKIDSAGNKIWDKRYGGSLADRGKRLIHTSDGGYAICADTRSPMDGDVSEPPHSALFDFWILKLDSIGNKIWDRRFGGISNNTPTWIEQDLDGGFLVGGTITGDSSLDISEPAYGISDYWIFKIDSLGNKVWDKRFGGPGENILSSFVILPDSSLMLFGHADTGVSSTKSDFGVGGFDLWLVHMKYDNNGTNLNEIDNTYISIFPNPSSGEINIPNEFMGCEMIIYDLAGRTVYKNSSLEKTKINLEFLASGCFVMNLMHKEKIYRAKLILQ